MNIIRRLLIALVGEDSGLDLIADERQRQLAVEQFNDEHDDEHQDGSLAAAAACYAHPRFLHVQADHSTRGSPYVDAWPRSWGNDWDKRLLNRGTFLATPRATKVLDARIRELAKAGALCAAEIDRLQRARARAVQLDGPVLRRGAC